VATATDLNNSGFEIELRTETVGWCKITFIEDDGTTTEIRHYFFTGNISELNQCKMFYRLNQIDFDGSAHLSNVIEVIVSLPNVFKLDQNYPNLFNPVTSIQYAIADK